MKTNESLLHKGMRTIVQSALRREANEPCHVCWVYQPHRPEKPLPQPQDKKQNIFAISSPSHLGRVTGYFCIHRIPYIMA